jgi:transcriptional regulator with XRE-family HTH domain
MYGIYYILSEMFGKTNMLMLDQLRLRRAQMRHTLQTLADLAGINRPYLSSILTPKAKVDVRASTLEALAGAMGSEWVLVPKHLMPEMRRLLSGKTIAPDDVPSSMERMFGGKL